MSDDILGRPLEDFNTLFRSKAASPSGRRLAEFIGKHKAAMEMATANGRPAIAPLFALLPLDLSEELAVDHHLLRTFGHLVGVQMKNDGYTWDVSNPEERQAVSWPYSRKSSDCQIYRKYP